METIVGLLVALSIASERLVEIIKSAVPFLNETNSDSKKEGWRKSFLQAMAVGSGIGTALLASPVIASSLPEKWNSPLSIIALGLLASGGSGFWNAILSYVLQVKNLKKVEVAQQIAGNPEQAQVR